MPSYFSGTSIRLKRSVKSTWSGNLLTLVVSLLIAAGVAEFAIRLIVPEYQFVEGDEHFKARLRVMPRSDSELANVHFDSGLGWRMTPFWEERGVHHNSHGYRSPHEFETGSQGLRIVTIGDSFTYGLGVEDGETYSAILEEASGAEVINTGVNAYGLDQSLLLWEREAKQLNPDIVILGYYTDEFNRNSLTVRSGAKPYFVYDEARQEFQLSGVPVPTIEELASNGGLESEKKLRIWQLLTYSKDRFVEKLGMFDSADRDLRARLGDYLLKRLRDSVEESGARFLVLVIGDHVDGIEENIWIEKKIMESCRVNGIDCLNIAVEMRKHDFQSFYLSSNGHWSELGHRFAAAAIVDALGL